MENETIDLTEKPAGNKDLWLFLIIIDIVLLCAFGFFLYKHFSTHLFEPTATVQEESVVAEEEALPEPVEQEVLSVAQEPAEEVAVAKPQEPQPVAEKTLVSQLTPAEDKTPSAAGKKSSVVVSVNPKSKYRRVTFRWYGEGKKVAIVSGFTMSKPQALKKKDGYWETTLSILPGTYKFLYVVDGENRQDPYSPEKDGRSLVFIE